MTVESEELPFSHLRETIERSVPSRGGSARSSRSRRTSRRTSDAPRSRRMRSACCRSSRTCCRTRSSSPSGRRGAAARRDRDRRLERRSPGPQPGADRRRVRRARHRHRHPAGEAEDHLRGLPAGRCRHGAQVRRHRARPRDQPRAGAACSAARSACTARRAAAARSRCTCRSYYRARPCRARRSRRDRAHARRASRRSCCRRRESSRSRTTARTIRPDDTVLLIVEDDPHYARVLLEPRARPRLQGRGGAHAAPMRSRLRASTLPTAISLDVFLPDMLGWTVLSQLKRDATTRHIPVQIVTDRGGAPVRPRARRILLSQQAADDGRPEGRVRPPEGIRGAAGARAAGRRGRSAPSRRASVGAARARRRRDHRRPAPVAEALEPLRSRASSIASCSTSSCPDISGFDLLTEIQGEESLSDMPIVVFTGRELTAEEEAELRKKAKSIVLKGVQLARAPARRDRALPAPRGREPAASQAAHARAPARDRRGAARQRRCSWWTTTCATSSR